MAMSVSRTKDRSPVLAGELVTVNWTAVTSMELFEELGLVDECHRRLFVYSIKMLYCGRYDPSDHSVEALLTALRGTGTPFEYYHPTDRSAFRRKYRAALLKALLNFRRFPLAVCQLLMLYNACFGNICATNNGDHLDSEEGRRLCSWITNFGYRLRFNDKGGLIGVLGPNGEQLHRWTSGEYMRERLVLDGFHSLEAWISGETDWDADESYDHTALFARYRELFPLQFDQERKLLENQIYIGQDLITATRVYNGRPVKHVEFDLEEDSASTSSDSGHLRKRRQCTLRQPSVVDLTTSPVKKRQLSTRSSSATNSRGSSVPEPPCSGPSSASDPDASQRQLIQARMFLEALGYRVTPVLTGSSLSFSLNSADSHPTNGLASDGSAAEQFSSQAFLPSESSSLSNQGALSAPFSLSKPIVTVSSSSQIEIPALNAVSTTLPTSSVVSDVQQQHGKDAPLAPSFVSKPIVPSSTPPSVISFIPETSIYEPLPKFALIDTNSSALVPHVPSTAVSKSARTLPSLLLPAAESGKTTSLVTSNIPPKSEMRVPEPKSGVQPDLAVSTAVIEQNTNVQGNTAHNQPSSFDIQQRSPFPNVETNSITQIQVNTNRALPANANSMNSVGSPSQEESTLNGLSTMDDFSSCHLFYFGKWKQLLANCPAARILDINKLALSAARVLGADSDISPMIRKVQSGMNTFGQNPAQSVYLLNETRQILNDIESQIAGVKESVADLEQFEHWICEKGLDMTDFEIPSLSFIMTHSSTNSKAACSSADDRS